MLLPTSQLALCVAISLDENIGCIREIDHVVALHRLNNPETVLELHGSQNVKELANHKRVLI